MSGTMISQIIEADDSTKLLNIVTRIVFTQSSSSKVVASVINKLGRFSKERQFILSNEYFHQLLDRASETCFEFKSARHISMITHGLGKLGLVKTHKIWKTLVLQAIQQHNSFIPQSMANFVWGLARAKVDLSQPLFQPVVAAMTKQAIQLHDRFNPRAVSRCRITLNGAINTQRTQKLLTRGNRKKQFKQSGIHPQPMKSWAQICK